jgi:hypothetical protein
MRIRSVPLLLLGIILLTASATLGVILVHDGEVGTDEMRLMRAGLGDELRLKGDLQPFGEAGPLRPLLLNHSLELKGDLETRVIVTSNEPLPTGAAIVRGQVLYVGMDPSAPSARVVILQAFSIDEPIVFG